MSRARLNGTEFTVPLDALREIVKDSRLTKEQRRGLQTDIREGDELISNRKKYQAGTVAVDSLGRRWAVVGKGGQPNG
jgi:peptide methionine sulfoxide reductase MsrB